MPSRQIRCMITASRRATTAFSWPRRLATFIAQVFGQDHFVLRVSRVTAFELRKAGRHVDPAGVGPRQDRADTANRRQPAAILIIPDDRQNIGAGRQIAASGRQKLIAAVQQTGEVKPPSVGENSQPHCLPPKWLPADCRRTYVALTAPRLFCPHQLVYPPSTLRIAPVM